MILFLSLITLLGQAPARAFAATPSNAEFDKELLTRYEKLEIALHKGSLSDAKDRAKDINALTEPWLKKSNSRDRLFTTVKKINDSAKLLPEMKLDKEINRIFGRISRAAVRLVEMQLPLQTSWSRYQCDSVSPFGYDKWVQSVNETKAKNPYLGYEGSCGRLKPWKRSYLP